MDPDVTIIGMGPAGIQAGMHAARKKVSVLLIGKTENSSAYGTHVENYFGVPGDVNGTDMLTEGIKKAERFGCTILKENVMSVSKDDKGFTVTTESGTSVRSKALILASGVRRNKLGVPGEKELFGKGVSYCAECDCNFFKKRTVVVIGDESEAAASAILMTKYAAKTYWVIKYVRVSDIMMVEAKECEVDIIRNSVVSIDGTDNVTSVTLADGTVLRTDGVFIELGGRSSADLAMDLDILPDTEGMIKTDDKCRTSVPGVYACGDITGRPWQIAKAVGEGAIAGMNAADHVREHADR